MINPLIRALLFLYPSLRVQILTRRDRWLIGHLRRHRNWRWN